MIVFCTYNLLKRRKQTIFKNSSDLDIFYYDNFPVSLAINHYSRSAFYICFNKNKTILYYNYISTLNSRNKKRLIDTFKFTYENFRKDIINQIDSESKLSCCVRLAGYANFISYREL